MVIIIKKLHRIPEVQNTYELTGKKIRNLKIKDRKLLKSLGFWYNRVICGWCFTDFVGDCEICPDNSYWLCLYDEDVSKYEGTKKEIKNHLKKANTVDYIFNVYGWHYSIYINKFYNPKNIDNENDLKIQEKFIAKINDLINLGVLEF